MMTLELFRKGVGRFIYDRLTHMWISLLLLILSLTHVHKYGFVDICTLLMEMGLDEETSYIYLPLNLGIEPHAPICFTFVSCVKVSL